MAGSRIKGITVEIGGDTTKLQSALKGVNSEIKNTQSQLKDVEKLLKYDALQNDTTAAAIEDGRKMMKDPSAPRYSSMDALKAALDV